MKAIDVFLREHAFVHTEAVARAESFNIDYLLDGMTETQLRMRPHGMNSLAWLFWHVARVEDGFVSGIVMGRNQLFDEENWSERLNVLRRDFGTGMSKGDVAELSDRIHLSALWDYRDSAGRRTQSLAAYCSCTADHYRKSVEAEAAAGRTKDSQSDVDFKTTAFVVCNQPDIFVPNRRPEE